MRSAALSKAKPRTGGAAKAAAPQTLTEQAYRQLEEPAPLPPARRSADRLIDYTETFTRATVGP